MDFNFLVDYFQIAENEYNYIKYTTNNIFIANRFLIPHKHDQYY